MQFCVAAPLFHVLIALALAHSAFGQSTAGLAGITGNVQDPSGGHVPNAQGVISKESQGMVRSLSTNDDGVFTAPSLSPAPATKLSLPHPAFPVMKTPAWPLEWGKT